MKELTSLRAKETLEGRKKLLVKERALKVIVEREGLHRGDRQERKTQQLQPNNRVMVGAETA